MISTIKRLLVEVRKFKSEVSLVALTGIIYSVAYSRLGFIIKDIMNSFEGGKTDRVGQVALGAIGLAVCIAFSRYFHLYTMNVISEKVVNGLRSKLQNKFMRLNLSYHNNYHSGSGGLLSRILNDIRVVQDGLRMVADFFREPLLAILLVGNLFYLNARLTMIVLILLPLILWFLRQTSRSLRKYGHHGQESLEKMTSTIKESLDGVRIIQSFNLEGVLSKKLQAQINDYIELRKKIHSRIEGMGPITEFIGTCVVLGIFFYFSSLVGSGHSTPGDVMAYITSMLMINAPIKKLQESYVRIQETVVAAERIYQILDEPSEVPQSTKNLPFPKNWKTIEYRNVSFSYGNILNLKNINLKISRGEQVAFVGESGSGKSTLINMLERFFDPTEGEVLIDDTPIKDIDLKELRKNIALVTQDVFLFSDTIEKNIQSGNLDQSQMTAEAAAKSANAHEFIQRTKQAYQTPVGDRGNLLSGGEKQRISIARAVYKDAPILILDEATSALDSASEQEVQAGLDALMKGRTSLVIAHRLSTIQNADRIIVLKSGQIVEEGQHAHLVARGGEYSRFWALQSK